MPSRQSRRRFLGCAAGTLLGAALGPLPSWAKAVLRPAIDGGVEGLFYDRQADGRVVCRTCPWNCALGEREIGRCRAKAVRDGRLYELTYGRPCTLHLDPLEKGPLFHVRPGGLALALGGAGCNLACAYCQNWQVSQAGPWETKNIDLPVERCAASAVEKQCRAISFTYTEPAVALRYTLDVFAEARRRGILTHAVTAAYLNADPLKALCEQTDAFSAGLKGFDDKFYREIVGGELKPALDALQTIRARGAWLEVVTLIVPAHNDKPALVGKMAKWIAAELGADTPLHLTRFVPEYRLRNLPRTPLETLEAARQAALDAGLRFVYLGNVPGHPAENTLCPHCRALAVTRVGFKLLENRLKNGACPDCGTKLPGRWS